MSHFSVTVLVPRERFNEAFTLREQAEGLVESLLEPYDENKQVEEYERDCSCRGMKAKMEAFKYADIEETLDSLRKSWWAMPENERPEWATHIAAHNQREAEYLSTHPLKDATDPECDDCHGTGTYMTQYNPNSKWDWYQVGGRWTGALTGGAYDPEKDPANIEPCKFCNTTGIRTDLDPKGTTCNGCNGAGRSVKWPTQWAEVDDDVAPVASLPDDYGTFAVLTPDGCWHERGQMGWFGTTSNEMSDEEWTDMTKKLLTEHSTCIAVVVDCHI